MRFLSLEIIDRFLGIVHIGAHLGPRVNSARDLRPRDIREIAAISRNSKAAILRMCSSSMNTEEYVGCRRRGEDSVRG